MRLPSVPQHELFANSFLLEGEIADVLRDEWNINPRDVVALLSEKPRETRRGFCRACCPGRSTSTRWITCSATACTRACPTAGTSISSGLIGSLCLNEAGDGLAITDKGKTAAEMMVFARYIMFSEVYWHHAVRSATAMLQRAFYLLHASLDLDSLFRLTDGPMIDEFDRPPLTAPRANCSRDCSAPRGGCTSGWRSTASSSSRSCTSSWRAGRMRGWRMRRAICRGGQHGAGRRVAPHEVLFDARR